MNTKVELKYQRVSDAGRYYQILNNPNFTWFRICPESIEAEKEFLRLNRQKRKDNIEYNYGIWYEDRLIGGCGLRIDQARTFQGEIGYFMMKPTGGWELPRTWSSFLKRLLLMIWD